MMPTAEIITIGTELLLGEIQDTNTHHIARALRNAGIDLYRTTIVGDNLERIAAVIKEAISRSNIILTTGGLGPTVDDPTRNAIAKALGVEVEFQAELWSDIEKRFLRYGRSPTENNRKQAYIPSGALPIKNPVGTAPAFASQTANGVLIALPGVPREMEFLLDEVVLPMLKEKYHLEGVIKTFSIHTAGVGESDIDEKIADLEQLSNPTVGLVAHPGQTDIRVTAKASSTDEADKMITEIVNTIDQRLGSIIFGYNETTLEHVVASLLKKEKIRIAIIEHGMEGQLGERMRSEGVLLDKSIVLKQLPSTQALQFTASQLYEQIQPDAVLCAVLNTASPENIHFHLSLYYSGRIIEKTRNFGGHIKLVKPWAENNALDFARKYLCQIQQEQS